MAIEQKLTLTQLESEQKDLYRVRILWTSTQTAPTYNNVSHVGYLYYSVNGGSEVTVSVKYKLPPETEQIILDTVIEITVTNIQPLTLNARTWMNTYLDAGVIEQTKSLELSPMASTITATDAVIGSASTVTIRRSGAEHLCSVRYVFGAQSGYLTEDGSITAEETRLAAETISFAIPESFYAQIPNDTQGTCYLYCTTYSGEEIVGETQEASFIASANEEACKPRVTGTVVDVNETTKALTGNEKTLVRYHSNALCKIDPQPQHHATIEKMWVDAIELSEPELLIPSIQQEYVTFFAQDSRSYADSYFGNYTLIPYTHLTSTPTVERDDPTSGNATLRYTGLCFSGSFGAAENSLTFAYQIDSGEFVTAEIEYSITDGRYSAEVKIPNLDYRKVFTITARVSDRLETMDKKLTLKKGVPVFDWGEEDFAFHVPVQMDSGLNVVGAITVNGQVLAGGSGSSSDASVTSESIIAALGYTPVSKTGWGADKSLGTDKNGNVVEKADIFSKDTSSWSPVEMMTGATWTELGYFWNTSGSIVSTEYTKPYRSTNEKIPIAPNCTYKVSAFAGVITLYNASGTSGISLGLHNDPNTPFTFETTADQFYMGVSCAPTGDYTVDRVSVVRTTISEEEYNALPTRVETLKALYGKTVVCFGDSLFGMYRGEDSAPSFIAKETGATVYNVGFGGCRMAVHPTSGYAAFSMWALAKAISENNWTDQDAQASSGSDYFPEQLELLKSIDFNNVDICVIHYGTNDFASGNGIQIDNDGDYDDCNTLCGALRYSIEKLLSAYPKLRIYISLPVYRYWKDDNGAITYAETYLNTKGKTLPEFVAALRDVAAQYNLPIIDGYYGLGINKINASTFLSDGTHHNPVGRERFGRFIGAKLIV